MAPAQLVEHLTSRTRSSVDDIVPTLPDSLVNVCPSGAVEQSLIGFRVLQHASALPLTVRTTDRLLFFICLRNSRDFRRKFVRD
jgi:hypothetical protein